MASRTLRQDGDVDATDEDAARAKVEVPGVRVVVIEECNGKCGHGDRHKCLIHKIPAGRAVRHRNPLK